MPAEERNIEVNLDLEAIQEVNHASVVVAQEVLLVTNTRNIILS